MSSGTLDRIIEEVKTLTPEERRRSRSRSIAISLRGGLRRLHLSWPTTPRVPPSRAGQGSGIRSPESVAQAALGEVSFAHGHHG